MKKIIYFLVFVLGIVFHSCRKEFENSNYRDINEIAISELGQSHRLLYKIDTLKISPNLNFTINEYEEDRFSYEWKLVSSERTDIITKKGVIIGTVKNLKYPVTATPGVYTLYLKVTDKETNIVWSSFTFLEIAIQSGTGFLLIGEDDEGFVEVEMIAMNSDDTSIVKGLSRDNGVPRFKGAVDILHTGSFPLRPANVKQWVLGKEHAYYVNHATFETSPNQVFKNLLFASYSLPSNIIPVDIAPRINRIGGNTANSLKRTIVTNTGHSFNADLTSGGGDFYGNPTNRLSGINSPTFPVFPYIMHGPGAWTHYTLFDTENRRFVYASSSATNMNLLPDRPNDPFPWNQSEVNRSLVFVRNTRNTDGGSTNGNTLALMKNFETGQYFIYKFYAANVPQKRNGYVVSDAYSKELEKSKLFAFSSTRTALYFAQGSKLFAYDYNLGNEQMIFIKDFGEEITMIYSDIQTNSYLDLYVATYSIANKGTIHKLELQNNTNTIELKVNDNVKWKGLAKVINMSWKNSTH
ncbi:PKD-like family lipoprotein [Sphingobacterium sp. HJSM2_6]|uniref:PKD-like family lipoprotein n=1 Tax=Sphingobacterium sp. HJSM2_6 TaxID=3366264 RepID=UPI003BC4B83B